MIVLKLNPQKEYTYLLLPQFRAKLKLKLKNTQTKFILFLTI